MAKKEAKNKAEAKPKNSGGGWRGQVLLISILGLAAAFLPFAVLLILGMMPTLVSFLIIDRTRSKTLTLIVGFLNFSGCFPFLLELAGTERTIAIGLEIGLNPANLVIMYASAAAGYMIDWAMTGLVANIMATKGRGRLKDIEARKKELIRRWGPEVSGAAPEKKAQDSS